MKRLLLLMVLFLVFGITVRIREKSDALPRIREQALTFRESDDLRKEIYASISLTGFSESYRKYLIAFPEGSVRNHVADHVFGEYLYRTRGIEGIHACSHTHGLGCEHSVFLNAMLSGPSGVRSADFPCARYNTGECWHAYGHALVVSDSSLDTNRILSICSGASESSLTEQCANGVFMQYFSPGLFVPASGQPVYRKFRPDNPYEICTEVPAEFSSSCIESLVGWWDQVQMHNIQEIAHLCSRFPSLADTGREKTACFSSLGNYLAYTYRDTIHFVKSLCSLAPSEAFVQSCLTGATSFYRMENPDFNPGASGLCASQTDCSGEASPAARMH